MKYMLHTVSVALGVSCLFVACEPFTDDVTDAARGHALVTGERVQTASDTCRYELRLPANMDMGERWADTTIVRRPECSRHLLRLQAWGTQSNYSITGNGMEMSVGFMFGEPDKQWMDITGLPVGEYKGWLLACGNGGGFTLRIEEGP